MAREVEGISVRFGSDVSGAVDGLGEVKKSIIEAGEAAEGSLGSISSLFSQFGALAIPAIAAGAALAGLKEAMEFTEEAEHLGETFRKLTFLTGEGTDALNVYSAAMMLSGGSIDDVQHLLVGAQRAIKGHADLIIANGVATDKATLMSMPFADYLKKVAQVADEFKTPGERSQFLMMTLGRAGVSSGYQVMEFAEKYKSAIALVDSHGGLMTQDQIDSLHRHEEQMGKLNYEWEQFKVKVGSATSAVSEFFKTALVSAVGGDKEKIAPPSHIEEMYSQRETQRKALRERLNREAGEPGFVTPAMQKALDDFDRQTVALEASIKKHDDLTKKIEDEEAKNRPEGEKRSLITDIAAPESSSIFSGMAKDIADEQEMLNLLMETSDKVQKGMVHSLKDIASTELTSQIDAAKGTSEIRKAQLEKDVAEGRITEDEKLEMLRNYEQQDFISQERILENHLKNYAADQKQYDQGLLKKQKLEQDHQVAILKLDAQIAEAADKQQKEWLKGWQDMGRQMAHSMGQSLGQVVLGSQSAAEAFKGLFQQAVSSVIDLFVEMGLKQIENAVTGKAISKATAATQVTDSAAAWAVNAAQSVAAIPVVGWAMAPEVGASAYAQGMGYLAGLSAAHGFDIPAGVDPVVQLHQREMVLPADLADNVRQGGERGGDTYNIQAWDGEDAMRVLKRYLPGAMKSVARDNRLGRRS